MGIAAPLIMGGASLLGGALGFGGQQSINKTEIELANTQYQRSYKDMVKAGLNPAMMFGKGGPAPTPNLQNPASGIADTLTTGARGVAIDAPVAAANIEKTKADAAVSVGELGVQDAQKKQALSQAALNTAAIAEKNQNAFYLSQLAGRIPHQISLDDALAGKAGVEAKLAAQNILVAGATAKELQARTALEHAQLPVKQAEGAAGKMIKPILDAAGEGVNSLTKRDALGTPGILKGGIWDPSGSSPQDRIAMAYAKTKGEVVGTLKHWSRGQGNVYGGANSAKAAGAGADF